VTYCPDVIETRFTKVGHVRSECKLTSRVTPIVLTVSEIGRPYSSADIYIGLYNRPVYRPIRFGKRALA